MQFFKDFLRNLGLLIIIGVVLIFYRTKNDEPGYPALWGSIRSRSYPARDSFRFTAEATTMLS